jgi:hypothetical protein
MGIFEFSKKEINVTMGKNLIGKALGQGWPRINKIKRKIKLIAK